MAVISSPTAHSIQSRPAKDLIPQVYNELRGLADRFLRKERVDHTLQTTALVHEAYLKLAHQDHSAWKNRNHFFSVAAQAMRRILVDHARGQRAAKRGGGSRAITLNEEAEPINDRPVDLIALDEALRKLAIRDEKKSRIVELRFFGGLKVEEIANVLGVSTATVKRDWRVARAWLFREITKGEMGAD